MEKSGQRASAGLGVRPVPPLIDRKKEKGYWE
jgi:hypothetical protein